MKKSLFFAACFRLLSFFLVGSYLFRLKMNPKHPLRQIEHIHGFNIKPWPIFTKAISSVIKLVDIFVSIEALNSKVPIVRYE